MLDLRDAHLGQADVSDLPLGLQLLERTELIGRRLRRIDAVQLVQIDPRELEAPQTPLARRAQMLGSAVGLPLIRSRAQQTAFRRDDEALRIGIEGLGDEPLAHLRPVGVGGVDQGDPELHGPAQHGDRLVAIPRLTPDPLTGDPHRAEAEAMYRQVAADDERAALRGRER